MRTALLILGLTVTACGPSPEFYLRFEKVMDIPDTTRELFEFKGKHYRVASGELQLLGLPTPQKVTEAKSAAVLDGTLYVVRPTGGVAKSTDATIFTNVSTEAVTRIVAVGGALLAIKPVSQARMDVLRSTDGAKTFTAIAQDVGLDKQVEAGSQVFNVLGSSKSVAWLEVGGDEDLGANFSSVQATFEVRGEAVTKFQDITSFAVPRAEGSDGLLAVNLADRLGSAFGGDTLSVGLTPSYSEATVVKDLPRLHVAMPELPDTVRFLEVFGLDEQGRLLLGLDTVLVRSVKPFAKANDARGEVLKGPGCGERNTFEGKTAGDSVKVMVKNQSDKAVTIRAIDKQYRWYRIATVPAGASQQVDGFTVRAFNWLMASDDQETCLAAKGLGEKDNELVVPK